MKKRLIAVEKNEGQYVLDSVFRPSALGMEILCIASMKMVFSLQEDNDPKHRCYLVSRMQE